jgi:ribosomal protein S18 acetylase RimI-like enzyme
MPANIELLLAELPHQDLLMELLQEFYLSEHLAFNRQRAHAALLRLIEDRSLGLIYLINIINRNNEAAGYCVVTFGYSLEFHGRFALIDEFYIREAFRGLGIGAAALQFVEDQCRQLRISAIRLEVDRSNAGARRLYERSGFARHDRDLMTKWLDDERFTC